LGGGEEGAPVSLLSFMMYCIITTCSVECYWHCSDDAVHYKSDETVNFCCFRCATTWLISVCYILRSHILSKMQEIDSNSE